MVEPEVMTDAQVPHKPDALEAALNLAAKAPVAQAIHQRFLAMGAAMASLEARVRELEQRCARMNPYPASFNDVAGAPEGSILGDVLGLLACARAPRLTAAGAPMTPAEAVAEIDRVIEKLGRVIAALELQGGVCDPAERP